MIKNSKKRAMFLIISILTVATLLLLGATYAYYQTRIIGNESTEQSVSVQSKKAEITYEDGSAVLSTQGLIEPGFEASKTFYVKNTGDQSVTYSIILEDMNNTFERNQDWQVTLTKNGTNVISTDDKVHLAVGTHQILLANETIAANNTDTQITDTYVLTVKYLKLDNVNQSEDMGQTLSFKVNITEEQYTWDTAPQGSLLYALKTNQPTGSETTIPGREASTENEKRIVETEDDYGTSYVYRGTVDNNYVTYSNMCWRIVRVQGDGTIKLVLADSEHKCGTDNGYDPNDITSSLIKEANGAVPIISYSEQYNFPKFEESNIVSLLYFWAFEKGLISKEGNGNITSLDDLVYTDWCEDRTIPSLNGYPNSKSYNLGSYNRLKNLTLAEPILKCNMKTDNSFNEEEHFDMFGYKTDYSANRYNSLLGILTADEIAFAGATNQQSSIIQNNYLQLNTTEFWTMSPMQLYAAAYIAEFHELFVFDADYGLETGYVYPSDPQLRPVRPAIVLNSNVILDTETDYIQNGEMNTPYVIS